MQSRKVGQQQGHKRFHKLYEITTMLRIHFLYSKPCFIKITRDLMWHHSAKCAKKASIFIVNIIRYILDFCSALDISIQCIASVILEVLGILGRHSLAFSISSLQQNLEIEKKEWENPNRIEYAIAFQRCPSTLCPKKCLSTKRYL